MTIQFPETKTTYNVELVSPDVAADMLAFNRGNRKINSFVVDHYAHQMRNNKWTFTGHPIVFGESGRILDGQHRLYALIKANVSIDFLIIRGVKNETEAFDVIDTGKNRSASDILSAHGYKNSVKLASLARVIIRWNRYGAISLYERTSKTASVIRNVTNHEIFEYVASHPELNEIFSISESLYSKGNRNIKPYEYGILYYILSKIDNDSAIDFLNKLSTGLELTENHPIYVIRRKMEKMVKVANMIVDRRQKMYLCLRAWNDYRIGKQVSNYQYNNQLDFPDPI
jgi:hypothetical protein